MRFVFSFAAVLLLTQICQSADEIAVTESDEEIKVVTPHLEAVIRKSGYVSGVAGGSLLDKKTGSRDLGYGLDIVDWIMEPGSDEAYRDKLPDHMVYQFNNSYHGKTQKRSIEGPQICTKAGHVNTQVVKGADFVAVQLSYQYKLAAPGKKSGSKWSQTIVFPRDTRYFISSDRIDAVNDSDAMFLRIDMPGHIKHEKGDTFSEVYLSYPTNSAVKSNAATGVIPSTEFLTDFAPDERFNYRRDAQSPPERFIRGYKIRDPKSGQTGPWLAGLTLDPNIVYDAWCHQRGYICMIQEFGGRQVKAGQSFSAAFVVGYFDSVDEMNQVYDRYAGNRGLEVGEQGWELVR